MDFRFHRFGSKGEEFKLILFFIFLLLYEYENSNHLLTINPIIIIVVHYWMTWNIYCSPGIDTRIIKLTLFRHPWTPG